VTPSSRFARPPANAFDLPLVEELAARLGEIDAAVSSSPDEGPAFSGGVDFKAVPGCGVAEKSRMVQAINRTITTLYGLPTATGRRGQRARDRRRVRRDAGL
jgi:enoyl-CoA hydratase/carnithine racemase